MTHSVNSPLHLAATPRVTAATLLSLRNPSAANIHPIIQHQTSRKHRAHLRTMYFIVREFIIIV